MDKKPNGAAPSSHPVGTAAGGIAGAVVAGALVGTIAGPIGTAVGAIVGSVAGGLIGKEIADHHDQVPVTSATSKQLPSHEMVETAAYYIFKNGSGGTQDDDWFRAERELRRPVISELPQGRERALSRRGERSFPDNSAEWVEGQTPNNCRVSFVPRALVWRDELQATPIILLCGTADGFHHVCKHVGVLIAWGGTHHSQQLSAIVQQVVLHRHLEVLRDRRYPA